MFRIVLHRRAARYFERLDAKLQTQLRAKLEAVGRDPLKMSGVKAMAGEWKGFYRIRHGDLRIIFTLETSERTVVIAHLGPRGDLYQ
jgi:mRNA interferase RelE/StbE